MTKPPRITLADEAITPDASDRLVYRCGCEARRVYGIQPPQTCPEHHPEPLVRDDLSESVARTAAFMGALGAVLKPVVDRVLDRLPPAAFERVVLFPDPFLEVDRLGLWLNLHGRAGDWSATVYAGPSLRGVGTGATAGEAVRRAIEDVEGSDEKT